MYVANRSEQRQRLKEQFFKWKESLASIIIEKYYSMQKACMMVFTLFVNVRVITIYILKMFFKTSKSTDYNLS